MAIYEVEEKSFKEREKCNGQYFGAEYQNNDIFSLSYRSFFDEENTSFP